MFVIICSSIKRRPNAESMNDNLGLAITDEDLVE